MGHGAITAVRVSCWMVTLRHIFVAGRSLPIKDPESWRWSIQARTLQARRLPGIQVESSVVIPARSWSATCPRHRANLPGALTAVRHISSEIVTTGLLLLRFPT